MLHTFETEERQKEVEKKASQERTNEFITTLSNKLQTILKENSNSAEVKARDVSNVSTIHQIIRHCNTKGIELCVKELLNALNPRNSHFTSEERDALNKQSKEFLYMKDAIDYPLLLSAVAAGNTKAVALFLKHQKEFGINVYQTGGSASRNALHIACTQESSAPILDILLKTELSNKLNTQDGYGCTPAYLAACNRNFMALDTLYYKGANLDIKAVNGESALSVLPKEMQNKYIPEKPSTALKTNYTYNKGYYNGFEHNAGNIMLYNVESGYIVV